MTMSESMIPKTIHKYPVAEKVAMPIGAKILRVGFQSSGFGQGPKFWAVVDRIEPNAVRRFAVVPTGGDIPQDSEYVGSYEQPDGLMFHVFERP